MFENTIHTTDKERTPDNITKTQRDNTTFITKEYMIGKEPMADIVARRVMRELEAKFSIK